MDYAKLIDNYLSGAKSLRDAVSGMSKEQLRARPIEGKLSTHELVCHFGDFEPICLDRIKRVIAEDNPPMRGGDPDVFLAKLQYEDRDTEEELRLVELCRGQAARILRSLPPEAFERTGVHGDYGPMTLAQLVERITNHIVHHLPFIEEKKKALGIK